jgi:hypothetical protein
MLEITQPESGLHEDEPVRVRLDQQAVALTENRAASRERMV